MLVVVFYFQFIEKIEPCKLCVFQRIPHFLIIIFSVFFSLHLLTKKYFYVVCFFIMVSSIIISGYHVLIELNIFENIINCNSFLDTKKFSSNDLLTEIYNSPIVSCKKINWKFFGISMASWNLIFSFLLSTYWFAKFYKLFIKPLK